MDIINITVIVEAIMINQDTNSAINKETKKWHWTSEQLTPKKSSHIDCDRAQPNQCQSQIVYIS